MKRITSILLLLTVLAFPSKKVPALDYFGDISANRLVIRLLPVNAIEAQSLSIRFPAKIELKKGIPFLFESINTGNKDDQEISTRGKLEIRSLLEYNLQTKQPQPGGKQELLFTFIKKGWHKDTYELKLKIPYTVDAADPKRMLQISPAATAETRWRDPKNRFVDVISYWSGTGIPTRLKCEVIESTLGFMNKIASQK